MANQRITDLTADTAPSSDDVIYVVNDPGGTPADRKVTLANLAASAPFTGTFEPLPTYKRVRAHEFGIGSGSPTMNAVVGVTSWLLDAAATEVVVADVILDPSWDTTIDIDIIGANATGGGAGAFVWNLRYAWKDVGDNLITGETNLGNVTRTAAAANIEEQFSAATGIAVVADKRLRLSFRRAGGDAADTLANDWAFIGVEVRPTP